MASFALVQNSMVLVNQPYGFADFRKSHSVRLASARCESDAGGLFQHSASRGIAGGRL